MATDILRAIPYQRQDGSIGTMYECAYDWCKRRFGTVTDLNMHDDEHTRGAMYGSTRNPKGMDRASDKDREAVRRLLGLPEAMPEEPRYAGPRTPHGETRTGKSPEKRPPDAVDRQGYRAWVVPSVSTPGLTYNVTEHHDSVKGGTYFFCDCPSWPMMRGKGRDCKHIKEVIA